MGGIFRAKFSRLRVQDYDKSLLAKAVNMPSQLHNITPSYILKLFWKYYLLVQVMQKLYLQLQLPCHPWPQLGTKFLENLGHFFCKLNCSSRSMRFALGMHISVRFFLQCSRFTQKLICNKCSIKLPFWCQQGHISKLTLLYQADLAAYFSEMRATVCYR